jgi:3-oxoadipate enol-lactonase
MAIDSSVGILLLHAFPLDSGMWEPQIKDLAGALPVVTADFPGFGRNAVIDPNVTMEIAAEHAVSELDRMGLRAAVVCGLSMGGYVALSMWRRHPTRVLGLVLANTRAVGDSDDAQTERRRLAKHVIRDWPAVVPELCEGMVAQSASSALMELVLRIALAQPARALAAALHGMAARRDFTPDLHRIKVPTLVVSSTEDGIIPPKVSFDMAARIPGATTLLIPNVGHMSSMEAPAVFTEALVEHARHCGLVARE